MVKRSEGNEFEPNDRAIGKRKIHGNAQSLAIKKIIKRLIDFQISNLIASTARAESYCVSIF